MNNNFNNEEKEFSFYDIYYFLIRNYIKILIGTLISLVIGCFVILKTKPIYSSNAKLLIQKNDENKGFGLDFSSLQGFSDLSTVNDKIEILRSKTIAEAVINELIKPVSYISISQDGSILYKSPHFISEYSIPLKKIGENNIPQDISNLNISGKNLKSGCGFLNEYLLDDNFEIDFEEIKAIDEFGNDIEFYFYDKENLSNPCDLPDYRELHILNTKRYNPVGFRKTFDSVINLGSLIGRQEINSDFNYHKIRRIVKNFQNSTRVENIQGTNILSVTINSLDYIEAQELVSQFVKSYIKKEKEWANLEVGYKINFLKKQIYKKRLNINKIEDSIQKYQQKENIYNDDGNSKLLLSNFLELENMSNKEKISYKDLKYRRDLFKDEINKSEIPKSYELSIKDSIRSLNIQIELSSSRIKNINSQLEDYQASLDKLPEKTKNLIQLKRDRLILENTLIVLEEKLQTAEIIFESESGPAQIIVEPGIEVKKVKPKLFSSLLLSLFLGITLSSGFIYLIEFLNTTIKTIEDLEKYNLNVLSVIPSIGSNKKRSRRMNKKKHIDSQKDVVRRLITTEDPKSPISEAYRSLRTSVMYSGDQDNTTLMVSSPGPGEGKTTTICNLAITYANLGKKTILIDADLRKSIIHKIFNVEKEKGLTKYIVDTDCDYKNIISKTDINNLSVIGSGITPPNPSELLNSYRMKDLIKSLKKEYDIVLIDTPPMIAVTDALILSKITDKFILVCRSGVSQKGALDRSLKSLEHVGGKLSGVVLNAFEHGATYGSGYYYNYYQYYYGEK